MEFTEDMGLPIESSGTGGRRCLDVGGLLPVGSSGDTNIWIGDVVDVSINQEDTGRLSTLGDMPTYGAAYGVVGRQGLFLPPAGD